MSDFDQTVIDDLRQRYPGLRTSHLKVTSERDHRYNCVAWAMGDNKYKWMADPIILNDPSAVPYCYWPEGAPREDTLRGWIAMLRLRGFRRCSSAVYEAAYERVAIYGKVDRPMHMALQKSNGRWTSKLGEENDIEHELEGLNDSKYGRVLIVLRRKLNP
jgi:hypothetical protein